MKGMVINIHSHYKVTHVERLWSKVGTLSEVTDLLGLDAYGKVRIQWYANHEIIFRGKYKIDKITKGEYELNENKL